MTTYFCFDVESIGLYGEGFAVGWVVSDGKQELSSGYLACPHEKAQGRDSDRDWVIENVIPHLNEPNCFNPREVRLLFWEALQKAKLQDENLIILADCGYPANPNFLRDCVKDSESDRMWKSAYPLHEVATKLLACGKNPLGTYPRLETELPVHHPTADAWQSLRVYLQA